MKVAIIWELSISWKKDCEPDWESRHHGGYLMSIFHHRRKLPSLFSLDSINNGISEFTCIKILGNSYLSITCACRALVNKSNENIDRLRQFSKCRVALPFFTSTVYQLINARIRFDNSTSSYFCSPASEYFDCSIILSTVIKGQNRSITSSGFILTALPIIFFASQVSL